MADIEVLAKQTHEIAVRKKYRTGAMCAHQRRFLPEMGVVAGNPGPFGSFTYAGFAGKPVNPASTRAKVARAEKPVCGFYLFAQQPFFIGFDICGFKRVHFARWYTFQINRLVVSMVKSYSPKGHKVHNGS